MGGAERGGSEGGEEAEGGRRRQRCIRDRCAGEGLRKARRKKASRTEAGLGRTDGHFQVIENEVWGKVWEEWKHKGSVLGPGKDGPQTAVESLIVSKWNVTARNTNPPTPNLHMVDEHRGMEMNLTPEGCFYRYPNLTESPQNNWTLMAYGYWM